MASIFRIIHFFQQLWHTVYLKVFLPLLSKLLGFLSGLLALLARLGKAGVKKTPPEQIAILKPADYPALRQWPTLPRPQDFRCLKVTLQKDCPYKLASNPQAQEHFAVQAWRASLKKNFGLFENLGFGSALFCHGTFVGHDPLSLMQALKALIPELPLAVENSLKRLALRQAENFLGDNGNFLTEHIALYEKSVQWKNAMSLYRWSSANHHIARLNAALKLAEHFERLENQEQAENQGKPRWSNDNGVILFGHSHAGQVFALFTRLLAEASGQQTRLLLDFVENFCIENPLNLKNLKRLYHKKMLFVTLGSPNRYRWTLNPNQKLLCIVNCRLLEQNQSSYNYQNQELNKSQLQRLLAGVLHTKEGDYVQLWGSSASDFPAATAHERDLNLQLDKILGPGSRPSSLFKSGIQNRVCEQGFTILANFQDNSALTPNFIASGFGHTVYTRFEAFLPITTLVREFLTGYYTS